MYTVSSKGILVLNIPSYFIYAPCNAAGVGMADISATDFAPYANLLIFFSTIIDSIAGISTAFNIFIRQSLRIGGIPFKIISDERGFYNKYNQKKLHAAAKRMNEGKYIVHDIVE